MASKAYPKEETYSRDPSHSEIESLSYRLGDLRDPRTFPHCSRAASSRYSVPAGPSRGARHFLLLVSNMGQFPELTLVHRQTTEAWLPTPGAGDTSGSAQATTAQEHQQKATCVKFHLLQVRWLGVTIPNTDSCLVPVHLNIDCYRTINNLRGHPRFQPRAKVWDRGEEGVHS